MNKEFELEYITKGNTSPVNKRKVFFLSTNEDYDLYFSSLTNEIFSYINPAIYYVKDISIIDLKDLDIQASLKTMDLFLMPITNNLFKDPKVIEIVNFLKSNNLSILPILEEENLVLKFSNLFGDIQFLDKVTHSLTEIPYEEKLQKFLNNLLADDELVNKIKDSFDAYIFMSYRKKDRESAQKLMKIIHSNEFLRSIAIWYDEYLIPGEHFEDAIKKALVDSNLFALVVTPNLLEKENYVRNVEYKLAKKYEKDLVPFMLENTDIDELNSLYKDLPEIVNFDEKLIGEKILTKVGKFISKDNNSKEHNFFIGLAYLHGIDVEKNIDLAITLFNEAADNNLKEALYQLFNIYKNGQYVKKDMNLSYSYFKRYLTLAKKEFFDLKTKESLITYLEALNLLYDYNLYFKNFSYLKFYKKEISQIINNFNEYKNICLNYFAKTLTNYANKNRDLKKWKTISKSYLKSLRIYQEILNNESNETQKLSYKLDEILTTIDFFDFKDETNCNFSGAIDLEKEVFYLMDNYENLKNKNNRFDIIYSLVYTKEASSLLTNEHYDEALKYILISLPKSRKYAFETNSIEGKKAYLEAIKVYLTIYQNVLLTSRYLVNPQSLVKDIESLFKKSDYILFFKDYTKIIYLGSLISHLHLLKEDEAINKLKALFIYIKENKEKEDSLIVGSYYTLLKLKLSYLLDKKFINDEIDDFVISNYKILYKSRIDSDLAFNLEAELFIYDLKNYQLNTKNDDLLIKEALNLKKIYTSFKVNKPEVKESISNVFSELIKYFIRESKYKNADKLLDHYFFLLDYNDQLYQYQFVDLLYLESQNSKKRIEKLMKYADFNFIEDIGIYNLHLVSRVLENTRYKVFNDYKLIEEVEIRNFYYLLKAIDSKFIPFEYKFNFDRLAMRMKYLTTLLFSKHTFLNEDIYKTRIVDIIFKTFNDIKTLYLNSDFDYLKSIDKTIEYLNVYYLTLYSFDKFNISKFDYKKYLNGLDLFNDVLKTKKYVKTIKTELEIIKNKLLKIYILIDQNLNLDSCRIELNSMLNELEFIKEKEPNEYYLIKARIYELLIRLDININANILINLKLLESNLKNVKNDDSLVYNDLLYLLNSYKYLINQNKESLLEIDNLNMSFSKLHFNLITRRKIKF